MLSAVEHTVKTCFVASEYEALLIHRSVLIDEHDSCDPPPSFDS